MKLSHIFSSSAREQGVPVAHKSVVARKLAAIAGLILMTLIGFVEPGFAQETTTPNAPKKVSRLDINSDGYISRNEASPALLTLFERLDSDGDDRLNAAELAALKDMAARAAEPKTDGLQTSNDALPRFFAQRDSNSDNLISSDEAGPALKKTFKNVDSDGDGMLDARELKAMLVGMRNRRDRSGERRKAATASSPSAAAGANDMALSAYWTPKDSNSDNLISVDEAGPALRKTFKKLDRDGNGLLDMSELRAIGTANRNRSAVGDVAFNPGKPSTSRQGSVASGEVGEAIAEQVRLMTIRESLDGAAVIIARRNAQGKWTDIVRSYTGSYRPNTVVAIASTTKWFTAATVASVVAEGKIAWDQPITQCIEDVPSDKRSISLRQTLSHVSGLPALSPAIEATFANLKASAGNALRQPLIGAPGTRMRYSGTAFQVASRCAEVGSGNDFRVLFSERIAKPLKLEQTAFGGEGRAPGTGGGLGSSPADLETFTKMIAGRGETDGVRVLSEKVMRDMTRLATATISKTEMPNFASGFAGMGTGIWCERANADGDCDVVSSIGAFGTYAWVDYERGEYGVFFVRTSLRKAMPYVKKIRDVLKSSLANDEL